LVEALGLLVVQVAITEVEGAAGPCKRNLFSTMPANDLDIFVIFVVDDIIEVSGGEIHTRTQVDLSRRKSRSEVRRHRVCSLPWWNVRVTEL
jgi:hypothetical protein